MRGRVITALALGAAALGACASGPSGDQPAWFTEREGSVARTFPSLQSVPRDNNANTDPAYWAEVQEELLAAGAQVRSNPRSQPATAEDDPALFLEEARREIEQARLAHEPN